MDRKMYLSMLAALATAAAAAVACWLLAPVADPIGWALLIGVSTIPYYRKLHARMPKHPNSASGLMVLIITLGIVVPVMVLGYIVASTGPQWLAQAEKAIATVDMMQSSELSHHPVVQRVMKLMDRVGVDIPGHAARLAGQASQYLVNAATATAKNMAQILLTLFLTLFILFFLYRDGERIVTAGMSRFPDQHRKTLHYLYEIQSTINGVVVGTLFTAFMQGVLGGAAYYAAGLPVPILLGALTAVAGMVPVVGTTVIWGPIVVVVAMSGAYLKAALLCLWGMAVVVAFADVVIRPVSAAGTTDVPALAVVLGAIGGAVVFGVIGLLIGPIIFGVLVMIWRDLTGIKPM